MNNTKKLTLSAMFLALGLLLPFLTGQIREIGNKLLPMHLPILTCGLLCGPQYGLLVGLLTPLLRSFLFSMPAPPQAIAMAFELATYGFIIGTLYGRFCKYRAGIYLSLLPAMFAGRLVWGISSAVIYNMNQSSFTWKMFVSGAFLQAIPGIILQLTIIPCLMLALEKTGVYKHAT